MRFVLFCAFASISPAAVISFSGLSGANADPFGTYAEAGYTVTPTVGTWLQGRDFGNPVPSIYTRNMDGIDGTIRITGGTFSFTSADFASNNGGGSYSFLGELSGSTVFSASGSLTGHSGPFQFDTIVSGNAAAVIDRLTIRVMPVSSPTSINVDNIVLSTTSNVPEPATGLLLLAGLAGAMAMRRRTRRGGNCRGDQRDF
jgi:hypothetical protein